MQHPKEGERKSWIPVTNAELQRMATQSLIREVEEQQRELASKVSRLNLHVAVQQ